MTRRIELFDRGFKALRDTKLGNLLKFLRVLVGDKVAQ